MADNPRIEDLRRRVQKDPSSIAFAQLAEECRRAGQLHEAVDTCRAGLAIHPAYLSARVTLGRALVELNQLEEGQAELEQVLASAPENLAAIRCVADVHHRRGELKEALTHYRAALALARNDPDLEQTVSDLARQVEPPLVLRASEGLSLEQISHELLKYMPPPVAPPPQPEPVVSPVSAEPLAPSEPLAPLELPDPVRERAVHTIAALEQWLDAIHVARVERHS